MVKVSKLSWKIFGNKDRLFTQGASRPAVLEKSGNKAIQQRIIKLIQSISETPFDGIGKPEPLKYDYTGWWSRRINEEHRLVYQVEEGKITIAQMRFHY